MALRGGGVLVLHPLIGIEGPGGADERAAGLPLDLTGHVGQN